MEGYDWMTRLLTAGLLLAISAIATADDKIRLTISGGHETDPRDHGRPVVLVANALGVTPEVFRKAFSGVTPAGRGQEPSRELANRNKRVLLDALSQYGVTNDLLDGVSDYYRLPPGPGNVWRNIPAVAYVTLGGGAPVITIENACAGYTSPPEISVPGHPEIRLKATVAFGRDLKTNGSVAAITVQP